MPGFSPGSGQAHGPGGFDALRESMWRTGVPMRLDPLEPVGERFVAQWWSAQWGRVGLVRRLDTTPTPTVEVVRSASAVSRGDLGLYALCLPERGGVTVTQNDRQQSVPPGGMALLDTTVPFTYAAGPEAVGGLTVVFPHDALGVDHDRVLASLVGRALPTGHGVGALLPPLLRGMSEHPGEASPASAEYAAGAVLDLLSTFLSEVLDTQSGRDGAEARSLVLRAKAYIRRRLADPGLSPRSVAAAHHVSLRHLQKLFADQDLTVAGFIRRERLEQCRRRLDHAARTATTITEIAFQTGFRDTAHFSRAFKAAYGISPREYRALADSTDSPGTRHSGALWSS